MNDGDANGPVEPVALPITSELDLHSFQPLDASDLVIAYLEACRERGILEVRIVHGKGRGMLARTVHATLARLPFVTQFAWATPHFGGHGATFVHLKPADGRPSLKSTG